MKKLSRFLSIVLAFVIVSVMALPFNATAETVASENMKIGSNFWFLAQWSGEIPFKEGVDWETAYTKGDNIWNDVFISELEPYKHLRFMDWGKTNNSKVVSWEDRRLPNDPENQWASEEKIYGLAYEWIIDLCNRTKKDMWLCIPHPANDDYIRNLAKLVKEKMSPEIHCYIEYSNETWNSQFEQFAYCRDKGYELNLPGSDSAYVAEGYNLYRSLQIFDIFDEVFGDDIQNRITKICSISANEQWFNSAYYNIFLDSKYNPNWQKPDMLCIAPYVGGDGLDGNDPEIATKFRAVTDTMVESVKKYKIIADELDLRLGTYEGGQHLLVGADVFSKNPKIYDEYIYMLDQYAPYLEFFTHYAHCGTPASGGAWGAKFFTGQPIAEAHRYRALVDWTNNHPSTSNFVISEIKNPKAPSSEDKIITSAKKKIYGTAQENVDITLKIGSKVIGTKRSDSYGEFSFKGLDLSKYKDKTKIQLFAQFVKYGKTYQSSVKEYKLVKLPSDVKIKTKKISRKTTTIKGTSSAKAKIRILANNKVIKQVTADKKGKFVAKVNLAKLKKKSTLKIFSYAIYNKKVIKTKVFSKKIK